MYFVAVAVIVVTVGVVVIVVVIVVCVVVVVFCFHCHFLTFLMLLLKLFHWSIHIWHEVGNSALFRRHPRDWTRGGREIGPHFLAATLVVVRLKGGNLSRLPALMVQGYDYYGTVVNTAARVTDTGHGGQIVVSARASVKCLSIHFFAFFVEG